MTRFALLVALCVLAGPPCAFAAPAIRWGDNTAAREARPSDAVQLQAQADDLARQVTALGATVQSLQQQLRAQQQQIDTMNSRVAARPEGYSSRMGITKRNFANVPDDALMEFWVR